MLGRVGLAAVLLLLGWVLGLRPALLGAGKGQPEVRCLP